MAMNSSRSCDTQQWTGTRPSQPVGYELETNDPRSWGAARVTNRADQKRNIRPWRHVIRQPRLCNRATRTRMRVRHHARDTTIHFYPYNLTRPPIKSSPITITQWPLFNYLL